MDSKLSLYFFFIILLILSEYTLTQDNVGIPSKVARIGGGKLAKPGQFPFAVYIQLRLALPGGLMSGARCTGSILNKHWVLTAAHCYGVKRLPPEYPTTVVAGTLDGDNYGKNSQERESVETLMPNFKGEVRWDVALIRVGEPFEFDNHLVSAIPFIDTPLKTTETVICTMIGFGKTKTGDDKLLYYMEGKEIGCGPSGSRRNSWEDTETICMASVKSGTSTCPGDSGGPLVCAGKLAGVLSVRRSFKTTELTVCGDDKDIFSVYMSTLHYGSWIKAQIGMTTPVARASGITDDKTNAGNNAGVGFITLALMLCVSF